MSTAAKRFLALIFLNENEEANDLKHLLSCISSPYDGASEELKESAMPYLDDFEELINKTKRSEEEEHDLEMLDSIIDEFRYKHLLEKQALSQALGIVIGKYMDSKVQGCISLLKINNLIPNGLKIGDLRRKLYEHGERLNEESWAMSVFAFGNYLRHHQEWSFKRSTKAIMVDGEEREIPQPYSLSDINGKPKHSIEPLHNIGFSVNDIVNQYRDMSYLIVERLELSNTSKTIHRLKIWRNELRNYIASFIQQSE